MSLLDLLYPLVTISSLSKQEAEASRFLVAWMDSKGFQAFVDPAGNAVGILDGGPAADGTPPQDLILLGHIDTVPGVVPVRIDNGRLFGRGSVDAKGPLAAFAQAAWQAGRRPGWRTIVIGAVEEEAASSKGARYALTQYNPALVVIGEPSGWNRVTLGYKGRMLTDVTVRRTVAHTANPVPGACEVAVDYWNHVLTRIAAFNNGRERPWDQILPSLRHFTSETDGLIQTAEMTLGFRMPVDFGPDQLKALLAADALNIDLGFWGEEVAYRAEKNTVLVRAFLAAIRSLSGKPGFVLKTGTSDMNIVGPVWRCPIVAYGPGDSTLDHTPEEHVEIEEWVRGVAVLETVLQRITAPTLHPEGAA